MDKREALEKVAEFIKVVVVEFDPLEIILFGSFARGTQNEDSDIDVAVILETVEGDLLDKKARLYKIRRGIDAAIEPLLIECSTDKSGFLDQIRSCGEILYTKSA